MRSRRWPIQLLETKVNPCVRSIATRKSLPRIQVVRHQPICLETDRYSESCYQTSSSNILRVEAQETPGHQFLIRSFGDEFLLAMPTQLVATLAIERVRQIKSRLTTRCKINKGLPRFGRNLFDLQSIKEGGKQKLFV